ncbi:hypothetical protein [Candidatus Symbiopectobacterium sp.]|uniref:hypothetical protein n=1 Tax=Candidatus Symbiopectobacterium sp. TaxID=2816440 RepID=UPI0025BF20D8|nr:hypothetical protein [Candidatus Symbiopectobacterium sp.]
MVICSDDYPKVLFIQQSHAHIAHIAHIAHMLPNRPEPTIMRSYSTLPLIFSYSLPKRSK